MIEFLKVLGLMLIAGLAAAGALVAFGVWHRNRHRWNAIDEVRPVGSEGHTGALKVFYKGGRLVDVEFSPPEPAMTATLGAALRETADWPLVLPWNGRCEIGWGPCWDEANRRAALSGRWPSVEFQEIVLSPDAPCQAAS